MEFEVLLVGVSTPATAVDPQGGGLGFFWSIGDRRKDNSQSLLFLMIA